MSQKVWQDLDFTSGARILNLPSPGSANEPATRSYVDSTIEGLSWKESVIVATQSNVNLAIPGATIDGVTLTGGDRVLVRAQTSALQNGIYIFDTDSSPMVRALDANLYSELVQAVVSVESGTSAGSTYRQTQVGGILGVDDITWVVFGTGAPSASETTPGIAEIATQAETDTGTDDTRYITPLKLATWSERLKKFTQLIGDGSATSFTVTHNFNTRDVQVSVFYNSGNYDTILVEIQRTSVNAVTIVFSAAPASNQFKVVVIG